MIYCCKDNVYLTPRKRFTVVLRGPDPRIHVFVSTAPKAWMAGPSPAKTKLGRFPSLGRRKIFPGQPCPLSRGRR
jgi:hypothetical protein